MKRWHEEIAISKRQYRRYCQMIEQGGRSIEDNRFARVGRFRKKHAHDCGNTQCYMCHGDKYPRRIPHEQERVSELSFKEQIRDL